MAPSLTSWATREWSWVSCCIRPVSYEVSPAITYLSQIQFILQSETQSYRRPHRVEFRIPGSQSEDFSIGFIDSLFYQTGRES